MKRWILFFVFIPFLSFGQDCISEKTEEFNSILTVEKVYLHTNNTIFQPGETIYFKAYVTDGEQKITTKSTVLYVEIIAPSGAIEKKLMYAINQGRASGSYDIPTISSGGLYLVKAYTSWQKNTNSDIFEKEITIQHVLSPRLLMKLEIEKEAYGEGDEVSAKISVRNLQDSPLRNLEFEYQAEIDGQTIVKSKGVTDEEGSFQIRFSLPQNLSGSDGSLNVKFEYESNTESISRSIPIILNSLDLQFMAEGGYSISGVPHLFSFKALNKYGNPADVKGEIFDQSGNKITDFESYHQGLGSLELTMEEGKSYFAKITSPFRSSELIPLPKTLKRSASLSLERINEKELKAVIYSNENQSIKLVGKTISSVVYQKEIQLKSGRNEVVISTVEFPMGILQFTLFKNKAPMAERLVFNLQDQGLKISIQTDKETYTTREKVNSKIQTQNAEGEPISANLSVSVVNDKLLSYLDDKQHRMDSWLLAGSELKGEIYEPKFYFDPKEEKRHKALDLLLLTQGWRFYNWESILSEDTLKIQYPVENLTEVEGRVVKYKRSIPIAYPTTVYLVADEYLYIEETDENGYFKFHLPTAFPNGLIYAERRSNEEIQIIYPEKKEDELIEIPRKLILPNEGVDGILRNEDVIEETPKEETTARDKNERYDSFGDEFEMDAVIGLNSVIMSSISDSNYSVTSDNIGSLSAIVGGYVAGIQINESPEASFPIAIRGVSSISGQNRTLLVVDGVPLMDGAENINSSSIRTIQVLKGVEATSMYGARASNGVIIIQTIAGTSTPQNLNINIGKRTDLYQSYFRQQFGDNYRSFSSAKEFYMPKYESTITSNKDDFRANIYWNYNVTTDEKGEAEFHFYNSDESTVFRIIAEGFDGHGLIGRSEKTYSTENELEMEVKFPLYATEGDEIQMPIWMKNNRAENLVANLSLDLPRGLTLEDFKYDLFLKANEIQNLFAPMRVENGSVGNYKYRVNVLTDTFKQSVTKDLSIFGRGFPFQFGQSTIDKANLKFESKNVVSGSESAIFTIYLNPLEPILSGLDRIVSQPHGCFEQLTSSVYPNIYALKLMSLTNTEENQKLERKVKRYMQSGYRKMIAYEVKGGGFDWFGQKPASVYLTAFGLLQFHEMKHEISVDEKMVSRNLNWLVSKKDSLGGYSLELKKNQKFDRKKHLITSAYVNYALSFTGYKDIELQYQTSYKEAIQSKDLYRLVLTALTAEQLGKEKDFNQLLSILQFEIFGKGFENITADGSITYSGKKSLKIEILALYAEALMKSNQISLELNQVMKEIVNLSNNGYFASTQATGLSLKAIYQYNTLYNAAGVKGDKVYLKINGEVVLAKLMSDYLELGEKEKKNSFEINVLKFIKPGSNFVSMEVAASQLTFVDFSYWYQSSLPDNSPESKVHLSSSISKGNLKVGDVTRLHVSVKNKANEELPMTVAKIGIPGGLSMEPTLLKELLKNEKVTYYELTDNFLVLYWRDFSPLETKQIELVLKAEVPGKYTGVSSSAYLYYTEEHKHWNEGLKVEVEP